MKRLIGMMPLLLTGCLALDPGGQVSRGLTQSKIYEWRDSGNFWVEGRGPQTERFTMVQGDVVMNADGTVNWDESRIAYYLSADPSAQDAAGGLHAAFTASTEQVKAMTELFSKMLDTIGETPP